MSRIRALCKWLRTPICGGKGWQRWELKEAGHPRRVRWGMAWRQWPLPEGSRCCVVSACWLEVSAWLRTHSHRRQLLSWPSRPQSPERPATASPARTPHRPLLKPAVVSRVRQAPRKPRNRTRTKSPELTPVLAPVPSDPLHPRSAEALPQQLSLRTRCTGFDGGTPCRRFPWIPVSASNTWSSTTRFATQTSSMPTRSCAFPTPAPQALRACDLSV